MSTKTVFSILINFDDKDSPWLHNEIRTLIQEKMKYLIIFVKIVPTLN